MNQNRRETLPGAAYARAICTVGIVLYHYAAHSQSSIKLFYRTANSYWGFICVTAFFTLSGMVLYHNYSAIPDLKAYFYRRWRSVFPAFYLCFFYYFMRRAIEARELFYGPHPATLLLTLFGADGYLSFKIPNYYLVGEWFLGAILLLYLLYPLLLQAMRRINDWLLLAALVAVEAAALALTPAELAPTRNPAACLVSFYAGILLRKHARRLSKEVFLAALAVFALLRFLPLGPEIPILSVMISQLQGVAFFILLYGFGEAVMRTPARSAFQSLSGLSFCIFLFQHRVILDLLKLNNPTGLPAMLLMIAAVFIATLVHAKVLSLTLNALFQSRLWQRAEAAILRPARSIRQPGPQANGIAGRNIRQPGPQASGIAGRNIRQPGPQANGIAGRNNRQPGPQANAAARRRPDFSAGKRLR